MFSIEFSSIEFELSLCLLSSWRSTLFLSYNIMKFETISKLHLLTWKCGMPTIWFRLYDQCTPTFKTSCFMDLDQLLIVGFHIMNDIAHRPNFFFCLSRFTVSFNLGPMNMNINLCFPLISFATAAILRSFYLYFIHYSVVISINWFLHQSSLKCFHFQQIFNWICRVKYWSHQLDNVNTS